MTREKIDDLRKEKVIFENMYGKLETSLLKKKSDINAVIEVANLAYQERDQTQQKLATMIQQSEKEQLDFDQEIKAVQDLIEEDTHMKNKI